MTETLSRRAKTMLALSGAVAMLCLMFLIGSPAGAQASVSGYCENHTLPGYQICQGASRNLYAVYGWGDQHSVCVGTNQQAGFTCSGGAGQGTFNNYGNTWWRTPWISNNAAGSNTVHGVAYQ